jgi:RND family efflux transporter MFP subunit
MTRRILWLNLAIAVVIVAVLGAGYFFIFRNSGTDTSSTRTVSVQTGAVSKTISATGSVSSTGLVNLSFPQGGTVTSVTATAGAPVKAGQVVATLDSTAAQQALGNAESALAQALANGVTGADAITNAQRTATLNKQGYDQAVASAQAALVTAQQSWADSCLDPAGACPNQSAWAQLRAAEGAVASAQVTLTQKKNEYVLNQATYNLQVNQAQQSLAAANNNASAQCSSYGSTSSQCSTANNSVISSQQSYDSTVNSRLVNTNKDQEAIDNANAALTSANVSLHKTQADLASGAVTSVRTARQNLDSAKLARDKGLAQDQQNVIAAQAAHAPLTVGDISTTGTQAAVDAAQAALVIAQRNLQECNLTAPVDGTLGTIALTVGQQAAANTTVATVVPNSGFEVTAKVSEADAVNVQIGQHATVTFSALPRVSATGTVTAKDSTPAASTGSTSSSVVQYGVTVTLDSTPEGVVNGMSASVSIVVDSKDNVLWAPSAAVTSLGGAHTVTIRKDSVDTITPVTVGLVGDSGTEITSGVSSGDQLVIAIASSTNGSGFPFGGIPGGGTRLPAGGAPPGGR